MTFRMTKAERKSGLLDVHTLLSAREAVKACGVVVFERLFGKSTIQKLRAAQARLVQHFH